MAELRCSAQHIGLLLLAFFVVIQASPVGPNARDETHKLQPRGPDPDFGCSFTGNPDLYGLGIRIGIYLQLFSTLLANAILSKQFREDAHNTNTIIMVALFAGMISATIKNQLNALEIYVMSMLLGAFLWSDFTPRHISSYVLVRGEQRRRLKMRERMSWAIPQEFQQCDYDEAEEISKIKVVYFSAIARSIFGTAIMVYNVWYWLYSRHTLLKLGIDDPKCKPIVFLHAQLELGTNQVMFYIIVAVAMAFWEVIFMTWWIAVLCPRTIVLLCHVVYITIVAIMTCKPRKLGRLRQKIAHWYLGFARLDATQLKVFARFKMRRSTMDKLSRVRLLLSWFGLPIGYTVVIFTALAVELTLAWNEVSGLSVLGSTGQLIPFVVGLLGFLRNMHLIAVQFSEKVGKKSEAKQIKVDFNSGAYVYELGKDKELKLEAAIPERRWSIDSGSMPLQGLRDGLVLTQSLDRAKNLSWRTT